METERYWRPDAKSFVRDLGRRFREIVDDRRIGRFLMQSIRYDVCTYVKGINKEARNPNISSHNNTNITLRPCVIGIRSHKQRSDNGRVCNELLLHVINLHVIRFAIVILSLTHSRE